MRAFIAIELPKQIKVIINNIQHDLKQAHADVKWVKSENIHLTLKFLGEISQDYSQKINSILNQISQRNSEFSLYLSELGSFPNLKNPRTIWIGVSNDGPVIEIAEQLEKKLTAIGFPPESRRFTSHITLGRVRSAFNRRLLVEKLGFMKNNISTQISEFKINAITLFKSTLTPQGPIYEAILNSPLKSTPA